MMYTMWMYFVILTSLLSASDVRDAVDSLSPQNGKCKLQEYPANETHITDILSAKPGRAYDRVNITFGQSFEVDESKSVRCDGLWTDKLHKCGTKCGTLTSEGTELFIGGVPVKRAEVPWHASIYTKTLRPYKQICGGSLIRNNIVISAAHCFWDDTVGKLPAADYAVAVGKLYRPWIDTRDEAQQSDVKEIHLNYPLRGSKANLQDDNIVLLIVTDPFEYTAHIRPVCVDFDAAFQKSQLTPGLKGKMAGWGLTSGDPSQELEVVDMHFITTKQCKLESPVDFQKYITEDKICAGYKQAGKTLCRGDSGSGLAFPGKKGKDIERYYLRGVVSTTLSNNNLCIANTYTTFTLLLKHEHFIQYWLAETAKQKRGHHRSARALSFNRNVVRTFVDRAASPPAPFQHLTVDRNTGRVYIGALNRIHQLTADLERTQWIVTGPEESVNRTSAPTDNANKALVIDYINSRLITCGSVFQGLCSVRNLSNMSQDVREVRELVVGNTAASSVAFIAPASNSSLVLYVGTLFTRILSGLHLDVPLVSSRSLEDGRLFQFASKAESTGTYMYKVLFRRDNINYVYGFSSEGFSYFLTSQILIESIAYKAYYSKLVRVCQNDTNYYSYTEIPISCTESGGNYTRYNFVQAASVGKAGADLAAELGISTQHDVLFAAFSQSETIKSSKPSNRSALCVYSLKAIRRAFTENIKYCFSGNGSAGRDFEVPFTNSNNRCIRANLTIDEDFCGLDLNSPLEGELPVETIPAAVFDKQLTAVAVTTTGEHTVVFAGTADGYLKKIHVDNSFSASEYREIDVGEGLPINKDLIFDTQLTHLYVMTERRISKVRLQECNEYKSCQECLKSKDPYCGWGLLENECNLLPDGRNATKDSLQWISYRGRCLTITKVRPNQLQRTTPLKLELFIENLPTYNGQFVCAFTGIGRKGRTVETIARRTSFGVSCDTPRTDTLPLVSDSQNHFTAKLSVRTAQGSDVIATKFRVFDCNTNSSCTQCVTSPFPCDWCLGRYCCKHDIIEHDRDDKDSNNCPRMNSPVQMKYLSLYIILFVYRNIYM